MIYIFYFFVFVFGISFGVNLFLFLYSTLVVTHDNPEYQVKFLTKQIIHLAIHLSLLLLLFLFFLTSIGLSKETLTTIYAWSRTCSGLFVGYILILIIWGGFQYVTSQ